ncbi:MAG: mechanosensitive ion channel family protein [Thermodesulfobacteriota bacterium]|jgi:small-conductance mechanosensitive channel
MTIINKIFGWTEFVKLETFLGALFYALLFLLVATVVARALRLGVKKLLERDEHRLVDHTVASFLTQLAQIGIFLLALIFYTHLIPALRHVGTALLASVGVVTVVIGLAAQNTLGNVISGISLLLYRPFKVGDRVQVSAPTGLETGVIENLTLGYTIIRTNNNNRIIIPNNTMASQVIINLTTKDLRVMATIPIGINHNADIIKVRQILIDLAKSHPKVQEVVDCPVTKLGNSSIVLSLRVWCEDAVAASQVEYDIYEQAKNRFSKEGIEISFPYTNVIIKKE